MLKKSFGIGWMSNFLKVICSQNGFGGFGDILFDRMLEGVVIFDVYIWI